VNAVVCPCDKRTNSVLKALKATYWVRLPNHKCDRSRPSKISNKEWTSNCPNGRSFYWVRTFILVTVWNTWTRFFQSCWSGRDKLVSDPERQQRIVSFAVLDTRVTETSEPFRRESCLARVRFLSNKTPVLRQVFVQLLKCSRVLFRLVLDNNNLVSSKNLIFICSTQPLGW